MISENLIQSITQTTEEILKLRGKENFDFGKALDKALKSLGFTFFTHGLDRRIYISEDKHLVLKVEPFQYNNEQNKSEILAYERMPKSIREYFCPILAYAKDYSWLIMPKAEVYRDYPEEEKFLDKFLEAKTKLDIIIEKHHIHYGDLHYNNVGILNGKEVIIDYGYYFKPYKETPDRFEP